MIIYCITNTVNNKKYIGQTRNKLARRWSEHLYDARSGRGGVVHTAMRKYGDDKFTIEQIDSARTLRELGEKETAWIERLNTHIRSGHGYSP